MKAHKHVSANTMADCQKQIHFQDQRKMSKNVRVSKSWRMKARALSEKLRAPANNVDLLAALEGECDKFAEAFFQHEQRHPLFPVYMSRNRWGASPYLWRLFLMQYGKDPIIISQLPRTGIPFFVVEGDELVDVSRECWGDGRAPMSGLRERCARRRIDALMGIPARTKPQAEDAVGNLWEGYWFWAAYGLRPLSLRVDSAPVVKTPWRVDLFTKMAALGASCFWLACATAIGTELQAATLKRCCVECDPTVGVSPQDALGVVRQLGLSMYGYHPGEGGAHSFEESKDKRGICWVPCGANGRFAPHWLSVKGVSPTDAPIYLDTSAYCSFPDDLVPDHLRGEVEAERAARAEWARRQGEARKEKGKKKAGDSGGSPSGRCKPAAGSRRPQTPPPAPPPTPPPLVSGHEAPAGVTARGDGAGVTGPEQVPSGAACAPPSPAPGAKPKAQATPPSPTRGRPVVQPFRFLVDECIGHGPLGWVIDAEGERPTVRPIHGPRRRDKVKRQVRVLSPEPRVVERPPEPNLLERSGLKAISLGALIDGRASRSGRSHLVESGPTARPVWEAQAAELRETFQREVQEAITVEYLGWEMVEAPEVDRQANVALHFGSNNIAKRYNHFLYGLLEHEEREFRAIVKLFKKERPRGLWHDVLGGWHRFGRALAKDPPPLMGKPVTLIDEFLPPEWAGADTAEGLPGVRTHQWGLSRTLLDELKRSLTTHGRAVLVELRPEILRGLVITRDTYFFVRRCGPALNSTEYLSSGCYNPERLATLECGTPLGDVQFKFEHMKDVEENGTTYGIYCLRRTSGHPLVQWIHGVIFKARVREVRFVPRVIEFPKVRDIVASNLDAKVRSTYALYATAIDPALKGILLDVRNEEFGGATRSGVEPEDVARSLEIARERMVRCLGKCPAFGV